MANTAELLAQAVKQHQAGDLRGAVQLYRAIVQADPSQAQTWYLLGAACRVLGELDEAETGLQEAVRLQPEHADAHNHLGVTRAQRGKLQEAVLSFRHALRLNPGHPDATRNLQSALQQQGAGSNVWVSARQAPAEPAGDYRLLFEEGQMLRQQGKFEQAAARLRQALWLKADVAEIHNALGITFALQGKLTEAEVCFREALRLDPAYYSAHNNLGNVYKDQRRLPEAQACYEQALRLKPDSAQAHCNLGAVLHEQGHSGRALECCREALRLKPDYVDALFSLCFTQLPILYESEEQISRCRENYRRELEKLVAGFPFDRPDMVAEAADTVGHRQPFFLAYQGQCDRDLQALYGRFICRIMAARYPQWTSVPRLRPRLPGERIRVGIVSGFFFRHSNWKIPIRGWAENLDRSRFELFAYSTGRTKDAETVVARRIFDHFVEDLASLEDWCRRIRSDNLHVLLFPETGMETTTLKLAALRLAPIQCVSWGHPNTSGMPTIDYYLSSDLMEPPDANEHYTEELVRLPNLSVHYTLLDTPDQPLDLAPYGVRPGAVQYLCCQALFKYLPQYDVLLCRIAAQVPEAQFIFLGLPKASALTEQFRRRLLRAFADAGLDGGRHVVLLPYLDSVQYQAVNRAADVFLDSIGWSGCNSTLEALACGLPVVTLPGSLMRGRHSLAILQMMGVTDTIATDLDDYVEKAVQLSCDQRKQQAVRQKVLANLSRVFRDLECVRALEAFLERAVARQSRSVAG
jgi:predicted O-linked N-acetylglucosamine transferase (SPINDLY family)